MQFLIQLFSKGEAEEKINNGVEADICSRQHQSELLGVVQRFLGLAGEPRAGLAQGVWGPAEVVGHKANNKHKHDGEYVPAGFSLGHI